VLQIYGSAPVRAAVGIYVWFFRGVPILVLLYLFYFGVCFSLGLDLSAFSASCLVLGLTSAAYQSQIFRGAINSLPAGQLRAARSLGMSDSTAIAVILLPQALRLSIPGWSNEYSILLKDSVLVSVLGTMELMFRTKAMATHTEEFTAFYATAAVLYFLITLLGVRLLRLLERTLRIPGYTHQ
jgi:polar amino acid transport system permease protein